MIMLTTTQGDTVSLHQTALDKYELYILDGSTKHKLTAKLTEAQVNDLAERIAKHNDLSL